MTCEPTHTGKFVNVYLVRKAYGGPEKGGWWYDYGTAIISTQCKDEDTFNLIEARHQAWCDTQNARRREAHGPRRPDTGSALSEGLYEIYVEDRPATHWPTKRPRYK
jgi:hypothetical protein